MKKHIRGAVYNTATATKLASAEPLGSDKSKGDYIKETLYLQCAGKYFLHGEGGENSKYATWKGLDNFAGEKIIALSLSDAKEWASRHLSIKKYDRIFGIKGGEEKTRLGLTVTKECKHKLEIIRSLTGKSISEIIEDMTEREEI